MAESDPTSGTTVDDRKLFSRPTSRNDDFSLFGPIDPLGTLRHANENVRIIRIGATAIRANVGIVASDAVTGASEFYRVAIAGISRIARTGLITSGHHGDQQGPSAKGCEKAGTVTAELR